MPKSKYSNIGTEEVDRIDKIFQDWLEAVSGQHAAFILHNPVNPAQMFCGLI